MRILQDLRAIVRQNWRTYLFLNIATYGAMAVMMILTALVPGLREQGAQGSTSFLNLPGLSLAADAYASGNVVLAGLFTFLANLVFAALLTTTLPSLGIPFFGVVATIGRAGLIGSWLTPGSPEEALALLPHAIVVVIELQAYVFASLGSAILWQKTIAHRRHGLPSAWAGYRSGVRDNARLYVAIIAVLFLMSAYEAFEVIYLLPLLH